MAIENIYIDIPIDPSNVNYRSLFEVGPWIDRDLDVRKDEYIEILSPTVTDQVAYLDDKRTGKDLSIARILESLPEKRFTEISQELGDTAVNKLIAHPDLNALYEEGQDIGLAEQCSLFSNATTEMNLETYVRILAEKFGSEEAFSEFIRSWMTDEAEHDRVLSVLSLLYYPEPARLRQLEQSVKQLQRSAPTPDASNVFSVTAYTMPQELSTQINHRNLAARMNGISRPIMGSIARDEGTHHTAYKRWFEKHLEHYPSQQIIAFERVISDFFMPGAGMSMFRNIALPIAYSGIYDEVALYRVMNDSIESTGLAELDTDLHPEAQLAMKAIASKLHVMHERASKNEHSRLEKRQEGSTSRLMRSPFEFDKNGRPVKKPVSMPTRPQNINPPVLELS